MRERDEGTIPGTPAPDKKTLNHRFPDLQQPG